MHELACVPACKFAANSDPLNGVRPWEWTEWAI
jgi:hypothetical protein